MKPILYLSPAGNDAHSGLTPDLDKGIDGPLKTPYTALMRIRQLRDEGLLYGPARVILLPGRYPIHRPIKIHPADSDVAFEAQESGTAEICGSREIGGFKPVHLSHGVDAWQVDVGGLVSYHGPFNVLFAGDSRLTRARWPHKGFIEVDRFSHRYEEVDIFQGQNEFHAKLADLPENWEPGSHLQVNILHCWVHERQDIESIDVETGRITLSSKTSINPHYTSIPTAYYIENDLRFLTEPGDWYLDQDTGMLTVVPPAGRDLESFTVNIPVTTQWLRLVGDEESERRVRNVHFKGVRFRHANWKQCDPGQARWEPQSEMPPRPGRPVLLHAEDTTPFPRPIGGSIQAASYLPGTIHGRGAENCRFVDCDFEGPSYYGIMLEDGCRNNLIQHCRFSNMGAGAIYLDGSPYLEDAHRHNLGNSIMDCDIRGGGHVFFQACGILVTHAAWTRILHNRIQDMTYTGISVGWQWSYDRGVNRDQVIKGNHVSDIGIRGDLWDMGGIYLLGYQPGTVVSENVVEEIHCRGFAGWGLYLDEGSSGVRVERNLVWKTHSHSLHEHWGRQNTIRHNCLAHGKEGGIALNNEVSHSWVQHPAPETRVEHNVITSAKGALQDFGGLITAGRLEEGHVYHDHNLMWSSGYKNGDNVWTFKEDVYDEKSREDVYTLEMMRQQGLELNGRIADPKLNWDRKTRTFTAGIELPQLKGNAALWGKVGPRKIE